jgi:hypothetical protein
MAGPGRPGWPRRASPRAGPGRWRAHWHWHGHGMAGPGRPGWPRRASPGPGPAAPPCRGGGRVGRARALAAPLNGAPLACRPRARSRPRTPAGWDGPGARPGRRGAARAGRVTVMVPRLQYYAVDHLARGRRRTSPSESDRHSESQRRLRCCVLLQLRTRSTRRESRDSDRTQAAERERHETTGGAVSCRNRTGTAQSPGQRP